MEGKPELKVSRTARFKANFGRKNKTDASTSQAQGQASASVSSGVGTPSTVPTTKEEVKVPASVLSRVDTPSTILAVSKETKVPATSEEAKVPAPILSRVDTPSTISAVIKESKELGPIRDLWNEAYEELKSKNPELVTVYENQLRESVHGMIASTAIGGVGKEELMKSVVDRKLQQYKDDTWKVKALGEEFLVKDMVKPLIGVIKWADKYVGDALKTNPMASIGWAGVMVFVPLLLNPSKQHAALLEGLDGISNVLVRSAMQEDLYIRRWESNADKNEKNDFLKSHIGYRDTLKSLYILVLKYQATSVSYFIQGTSFKFLEDMVQWRNWKELLESVKKQDEAMCQTYNRLNEVRIEEEFEKLDIRHTETVEILTSGFKDISTLLEAIKTTQRDSDRSELLKWLCSLDPSHNYNNASGKHEKGTGEWLLKSNDDFKSWKAEPNSLMWLNGKAGSGKSVLSSSVIKHLEETHGEDPRVALAYFYFSFNDELKQTTTGMLESIIKQICCHRPDSPPSLKALEKLKLSGHRPNLATLQAVLIETLRGFSSVYITVDALDECPKLDRGREVLLSCLNTIHEGNAKNLHMFWTSRRETDIERSYQSISSPSRRWDINLAAYRPAIDHDIGIYIDRTLSLPSYSSWPVNLKAEARKELMNKSDGMFQYISCQFDNLRDLRAVSEIRKALLHLPEGLNETYNRMLALIKPRDRKRVANVLMWLVFSLRPLLLEEIAEIFILDPEAEVPFDDDERLFDPRDVLPFLSGFVTEVPRDSGVIIARIYRYAVVSEIRLAHFSVKEFLVSNHISAEFASAFGFDETNAHIYIMESCLAYHIHLSRTILATLEKMTRYQMWVYVVQFWPKHLDNLRPEDCTKAVKNGVIKCFAKDSQSFLNMVRIRSTDNNAGPSSWGVTEETLPRPFYYACGIGALRLTEIMVERWSGSITDELSPYSRFGTPLREAVYNGHESVVRFLIDSGADVNLQSGLPGQHETALMVAITWRRNIIAQLLLENGADVKARHVFDAAFQNRRSIVQLLFEHGADMNAYESGKETPLIHAVTKQNKHMVQVLFENGADLNAYTDRGGTPLSYAVIMKDKAWPDFYSKLELM